MPQSIKRADDPGETILQTPGLFGDLPMLARLITIVGIPGLIALFLVYRGATVLPQIQQDITIFRLQQERNNDNLNEIVQNQQRIIRMMQRICATMGKSDEERQRCFDN